MSSTVFSLKRLVQEYAPSQWNDGGSALGGHRGSQEAQSEVYVDLNQQRAVEQAIQANRQISHVPFRASMPLRPENGKHGGWEGTFAKLHGGYPHMFESDAPEKPSDDRFKGPKINDYMKSTKGNTNKSGYANRGFGPDDAFVNPGDFEMQERMNQSYKWGTGGPGFRDGAKSAEPFRVSKGLKHNDSSLYRHETSRSRARSSMAIARRQQLEERRAQHPAPFCSSGSRSSGVFSSSKYMGPGASDTKRRRAETTVKLPPFKATTTNSSLATSSVLFRKH